MKSEIKRLEKGTIELTITISWSEISKQYAAVMDSLTKKAQVDGFRKGKAPKKMVEASVDKNKLYEEVLRDILPKAYGDAITEHAVKPVIIPKIELKQATEGKNWIIVAQTCEKPDVDISGYKEVLKLKKTEKPKKIWVPGQEAEKEDPNAKQPSKQSLDDLLLNVYNAVKVQLPELLVEQETNKLLSDLIEQTRKLGLSVEQYLASTKKTSDQLRAEYRKQAQQTLTLEFALEKIADTEGIFVSDDEIDKTINAAKTEEEKKALQNEKYYLASVLRRQKTLDFLAAL